LVAHPPRLGLDDTALAPNSHPALTEPPASRAEVART
jgi:hypothetical protein